MKQRPLWQKVGIDIIGILCLALAAIFGLVPGPGGIPLTILGLSLLATNHEWAERILVDVKAKGVHLSEKLFSDNPRTKLLLDIVSILVITGAVLIITMATRSIAKTAALALVMSGLILFFGNRQRFQSLKNKFRKT